MKFNFRYWQILPFAAVALVAGVVARLAGISFLQLVAVSVFGLLVGAAASVVWSELRLCCVCWLCFATVAATGYSYTAHSGVLATGRRAPAASKRAVILSGVIRAVDEANGAKALLIAPTQVLFPKREPASGLAKVRCKDSCRYFQPGALSAVTGAARARICVGQAVIIKVTVATLVLKEKGPLVFRKGAPLYASCVWIRGAAPLPAGWECFRAGSEDVFTEMRNRMVGLHRSVLGDERGNLLSSMVLGDRAVVLAPEFVLRFRNLGLSHVLAASGFNLAVVVTLTYLLAHLLIRSRCLVALVCLTNILAFVQLAGPSPSVVRSAIMCSLVILLKHLQRSVMPLSILSAALILAVLLDPFSLLDVGLQLSYAATLGLICFANSFNELMLARTQQRLLTWCADNVAVVMASQSAVMPIQVNVFGKLGMMFLPANLLVAPLLAPITILGFFSSYCALIFGLCPGLGWLVPLIAGPVDHCAGWLICLMLMLVNWLNSFAGTVIDVGASSPAQTCCYYASLLLTLCCFRAEIRVRVKIAVLLLFLLSLANFFGRWWLG